MKSVSVSKGVNSEVNAVYETSPSFLIAKGQEASISYEISLNDSVQAPVSQGQQLGTVTYYLDGDKLSTVSLVAETSVDKINLFSMTKSVINNWFTLLRL